MTYQTGMLCFVSLSSTYETGCCASFLTRASPPCCCAISNALSVSVFTSRGKNIRPADAALYGPSFPSVDVPNGGASGRRLPAQTIVLTDRRLGEAKYPRQMVDFPPWPLVSGVRTDSNRAGWASGAHFRARPIM